MSSKRCVFVAPASESPPNLYHIHRQGQMSRFDKTAFASGNQMDIAVKQGSTNRWILGSLCRGSECTERGNEGKFQPQELKMVFLHS